MQKLYIVFIALKNSTNYQEWKPPQQLNLQYDNSIESRVV